MFGQPFVSDLHLKFHPKKGPDLDMGNKGSLHICLEQEEIRSADCDK